jgi:hypothetical protein
LISNPAPINSTSVNASSPTTRAGEMRRALLRVKKAAPRPPSFKL